MAATKELYLEVLVDTVKDSEVFRAEENDRLYLHPMGDGSFALKNSVYLIPMNRVIIATKDDSLSGSDGEEEKEDE